VHAVVLGEEAQRGIEVEAVQALQDAVGKVDVEAPQHRATRVGPERLGVDERSVHVEQDGRVGVQREDLRAGTFVVDAGGHPAPVSHLGGGGTAGTVVEEGRCRLDSLMPRDAATW
jgi:hypothetical protein